MTPSDKSNPENMIFTLTDHQNTAQSYADWELELQNLRRQQAQQHTPLDDHARQSIHIASEPIRPQYHEPAPRSHFGDEELDLAYREYLRQRERDHNARVQQLASQEEDTAILLQEDWLAAQSALKTEANRRYLQAQQTVIMKENQPLTPVDMSSANVETIAHLPPCTVHVYDLPNLPSMRRIRVLSEQELMARMQEKLQIHLSNAMAGLVRQAVQKKLATLTYDLQMTLNEETAKVVHDVLEHNLTAVFRSIKETER